MKYLIHVDSRDRNATAYPNASYFRLNFFEELRNVTSVQLVSAELPFSFYTFSAAIGNTSLTVSIDSFQYTITLPDGTYSQTSLASTLQSLLITATSYSGLTCTVNTATNVFTITLGGHTVAVVATGASGGTSLAYRLGFTEGGITSGSSSVSGSFPMTIQPEKYAMLCIDEFDSRTVIEHRPSGNEANPAVRALAKLQIASAFGATSFVGNGGEFNGLPVVSVVPPKASLTHLTVSLRFHDGTLIPLNADYSFTLVVRTDVQIQRGEDAGITRFWT